MSSCWILAHRPFVTRSCVLRAKFHTYLAFYVVIEIFQNTVLCNELEQIFGDSNELVYAPLSVEQSIREGRTNYSLYFRFSSDGFLRSGRDLLYCETKATYAISVDQQFLTFAPIFCALCGADNIDCKRSGPLSYIGGDEYLHRENFWAHSCCFSQSPKLPAENSASFFKRCHQNVCSVCSGRGASLFCEHKKCHQKFHLHCAVQSKSEYIDSCGKFFCRKHLSKHCEENQHLIRYPADCAVYVRVSDWSLIKQEHIARIVAFSRFYQPFPVYWFHGCFQTSVKVVEINTGHWAYDKQFPLKKQYEVVANKRIATGEIFGEYVGQVCYVDQQDQNSHYCANIFLPEAIANEVPPLVIDSNKIGNEMRFINSISPTTAEEIKKNVEFLTLWVAEMPRIMLCALTEINVGDSLILDYGKEFFETANEKNK